MPDLNSTETLKTVRGPHSFLEVQRQYVEQPYQHQEWPKWMYHAQHAPRLVQSQAEAEGLAPGWSHKRIEAAAAPSGDDLAKENEALRKKLAERVPGTPGPAGPPDLSSWNKQRLAAYAFAMFGLDLDPDKVKREEILAQIEQAAKA